MPTYQFCCSEHGDFQAQYSMKEMPPTSSCPTCSNASPRVFIRPIGVIRSVGAATTPLDSRSIRNRWQSGWTPQYGHFSNTYALAGQEKKDCEAMNKKQGGGDRWQVNRSVLDGA